MVVKWVVGLVILLGTGAAVVWAGKALCQSDTGITLCPSADYKIVSKKWGDVDGRTVVFSGRSNSFFNGLGYLFNKQLNQPWAVVGYFARFEDIPGKANEYVTLEDGSGRVILKGEVYFNNPRTDTDFMLEKLRDQTKNPYDPIYFALRPNVNRENINRLFHKGDVVAAVIWPDDLSQIMSSEQHPVRVVRLVVRRYYSLGVLLGEMKQ